MNTSITLHVPTEDELEYRRFLLADAATMSYNKGWSDDGTGTYHQTPEQVKQWYSYWNSEGNYYAYVKDGNGVFVGEVEIHFPEGYPLEQGVGWIGVVIQATHRRKGYGKAALQLLTDYGFQTLGLHTLLDDIPLNRLSAIKLFEQVGFRRNEAIGVMELHRPDENR